MKVEIYSDVACPWCYIGKRRFERALAAFPGAGEVEVVYRPYQLNPDAPATAFPLRQYLAQRFGPRGAQMARQVTETARGEGIVMDFDSAMAANTLDAHRLLRMAKREYGALVQQALKETLLEAHFGQGEDIGDPGVLESLGAGAGMDGERVRDYLAGGEGRREVKDEIAQAQRLGITAVPTFVIDGRYAVQGAQPASAFLLVLEQAAGEAKESDAGAGGERRAEGSCAARD
jgi:predicted DsbA family dithiol-disulfide isomerase